MVSFATAASNRDQAWVVIVTIEGIGVWGASSASTNGLWKFCSEIPTYAAADTDYKPWLVEWPDMLSERVEILGGAPDAGELSVVILDGHDGDRDALTERLRTTARSVGYLAADCTAGTTSLTVNSDTPYTAGASMVFIGNEAMKVSAKPGSNVLTVTRACLDTDGQAHKANDRVYLYSPYAHTRRMRLYLTPKDGGSSADETQVGPAYIVDDWGLTEDLNALVIRGRGQAQYLARTLPRSPISALIHERSGTIDLDVVDTVPSRTLHSDHWPGGKFYVQVGDDEDAEIVELDETIVTSATHVIAEATRRGVANTKVGALASGETCHYVLVGDRTLTSPSFRFSPGPSPSSSRSSGTWTASDHFIDLILCLATSSAHPDDGLELTNYKTSGSPDEARSNWSSLPVGFGAGIPVAQIDVAGLLSLRALYPHYRFPNYAIGAPWKEAETFIQHIDRWFLKPIGAFVTMNGGVFSIVIPRTPLESESSVSVGNDQILVDGETTPYAPGIGARKDMTTLVSSVTYRTRGPRGGTEIITINNADFAGLYGQRGYYVLDGKTIELDVPGVAGDSSGTRAILEDFAMRRLWRFHRPTWALTFSTDYALYATDPGELITLTCAELPNENTGARGWTSVLCQIVERVVRFGPNGRGLSIAWKAISFGPGGRFGRIAPSGYITHVSGYTATIKANDYTKSDGSLASLPATDAAAFTVNDVLALKNRDGSSVTTKRENVSSKGSNTLTMGGDFLGNLAPGLILVYAPSDAASATQLAQYVYFSDAATGTVGATSGTAWSYAG